MIDMTDRPLRTVKPVPVPRQFWVVGGIHSAGMALFVGFVVLVILKFAADAATGGSGDANLPFALAWSALVFGAAFVAFWAFHYWKFIKERRETAYLIYEDRIEVARDGSSRPTLTIPLARVASVQSTAGPVLRPLGLATITVVTHEPADASGRRGRRWFPLPNIPEADDVRELIRSLALGIRE